MKRVPSAPLWKRFLEKELLTVVWRISLANRLITVASLSNCQGNPLKVKIIKEDNKRHLTAALERRLLTASPRGNPMIGGVTSGTTLSSDQRSVVPLVQHHSENFGGVKKSKKDNRLTFKQ